MPGDAEIQAERERLYESTALRDDLMDPEAEILLRWGEGQVERLAREMPDDFEQKSRFLRQLLKHINRFVGQREFNDTAGQAKYLADVVKWLGPLGFSGDHSVESLLSILPPDAKDMNATLQAVLAALTPPIAETPPAPPEEPTLAAVAPPADALVNPLAGAALSASEVSEQTESTSAEAAEDSAPSADEGAEAEAPRRTLLEALRRYRQEHSPEDEGTHDEEKHE